MMTGVQYIESLRRLKTEVHFMGERVESVVEESPVVGDTRIDPVRLHERVRRSLGIRPVARPAVLPRVLHHSRTYRIELHVAIARERVALGGHQARAKSAVPEAAGAVAGAIDVLRVALREKFHH